MIRLSLLYLFVISLMVVSWRRWFTALCGLVFLTVLTQHPDMPTRMFGVPGLNPWNALFSVIFLSRLISPYSEPLRVATPRPWIMIVSSYVLLIMVGGLVAAVDADSVKGDTVGAYTRSGILIDGITNPLKYLIVGLMVYSGAGTRSRVRMILLSVVASSMGYGLLMFKTMKHRVFTIDVADARRLTDKLIGLHANDMGTLLAFTIWAAFVCYLIFDRGWHRTAWLMLTVAIVPPFVALKSRAAFLAFCVVGLVLGTMKWRKILLALPAGAVVILLVAPGVSDRILTGIVGEEDPNWDEISAGRMTNLWPPVMEQIGHSPIVGHGRYAILRTDCYYKVLDGEGTVPSHPHNAYFEMLLDTGLVGLGVCMTGAFVIVMTSLTLMCGRSDRLIAAVGGVSLVAITTALSAGMTGSSFYPTQATVPYFCVWAAALRVGAERRIRGIVCK